MKTTSTFSFTLLIAVAYLHVSLGQQASEYSANGLVSVQKRPTPNGLLESIQKTANSKSNGNNYPGGLYSLPLPQLGVGLPVLPTQPVGKQLGVGLPVFPTQPATKQLGVGLPVFPTQPATKQLGVGLPVFPTQPATKQPPVVAKPMERALGALRQYLLQRLGGRSGLSNILGSLGTSGNNGGAMTGMGQMSEDALEDMMENGGTGNNMYGGNQGMPTWSGMSGSEMTQQGGSNTMRSGQALSEDALEDMIENGGTGNNMYGGNKGMPTWPVMSSTGMTQHGESNTLGSGQTLSEDALEDMMENGGTESSGYTGMNQGGLSWTGPLTSGKPLSGGSSMFPYGSKQGSGSMNNGLAGTAMDEDALEDLMENGGSGTPGMTGNNPYGGSWMSALGKMLTGGSTGGPAAWRQGGRGHLGQVGGQQMSEDAMEDMYDD